MSILTIGFKQHKSAAKPMWEGVLRDEAGKVVWGCGHAHQCRDYNHSGMFRHAGSARKCASEELAKRSPS